MANMQQQQQQQQTAATTTKAASGADDDNEAGGAGNSEQDGSVKDERLLADQQQESVYNQTKYWLIDDSKAYKLNKQFLTCTQTLNLRSNFLYWDAKSKEKQGPSVNESFDTNDTNESENSNRKQ